MSSSHTSGGGAPTGADYLVGTAQGALTAEIVVGAAPAGELGGTWAAPTVDTVHAGGRHPLTAVKTADEAPASDATLNNDADLLVAVEANSRYAFELYAVVESASATPDINVAFTGPAGSTLRYSVISVDEGSTLAGIHADAGATTLFTALAAASARGFHIRGTIVVAGTAGNLQFQWSQATSNATATILREGASLIAHKLS